MRRPLLVGLALIALAACRPAGQRLVDVTLVAMATTVELKLPAATAVGQPALIASIESELEIFGRDYYAWGDGELARLNKKVSNEKVSDTFSDTYSADASSGTSHFDASPAMAALLTEAQRIAVLTDGAFDPGVGGLVELWGFHDASNPAATPPSQAAIDDTRRQLLSITELAIDGNRIRPLQPGRVLIDLGGIAKGAAVDRIVARLVAAGVAPALVNAGGDLRVVGERADRAWRIGIQAPRDDGLIGTIELHAGEAAFTSGDYERFYLQNGERRHHIIDPRTGYPVTHTQAITVIAGDGSLADAAATALFVAGPGRWRELARALELTAVLRVDASGVIEMAGEMRDRFLPGADSRSDIIAAGN